MTIGDSWGTELPSDGKGISLILCNTERGKELVKKADVYLTDVNIEKALASNPQLKAQQICPKIEKHFLMVTQKARTLIFLLCNAAQKSGSDSL